MCTKCQTSRHRPLEFQTLLRFSVNKKLGRRPKRCFKRVDEDQDQVRISSLHHSARAHSPRLFTFTGWSHPGGLSSHPPTPCPTKCCLGVVSPPVLAPGGLSSGWTFIRVVCTQGGLYSVSVLRVVSTQGGLYSGSSVLRVVYTQGGLY